MLFVVGLACLAGCGRKSADGRPTLVPVSGQVLVNKQPSEGARVVFSPDGHAYAAAAVTDAEGRFELQTFDPGDGAVPGNYKVMVSKFEVIDRPDGGVDENHFLPEKYRNPAASGLTAVVTESGPNDITLDLVE
jgi:hypothetical protein